MTLANKKKIEIEIEEEQAGGQLVLVVCSCSSPLPFGRLVPLNDSLWAARLRPLSIKNDWRGFHFSLFLFFSLFLSFSQINDRKKRSLIERRQAGETKRERVRTNDSVTLRHMSYDR